MPLGQMPLVDALFFENAFPSLQLNGVVLSISGMAKTSAVLK
jgi:hypothetical protein